MSSLSVHVLALLTPYLCLILEILSDLSSGKVPHLNEPISTACDQVLTIWGEPSTLRVRFGSKFYCLV